MMTLTRATEADLPAVVELANLAYRGAGAGAGWTTETSYIEGSRLTGAQLRADLAYKPAAHLLVLREDNEERLQGTVWLEPKSEGVWYLGLLTIRPEQQKKQLGRGLLVCAETYAAERGAQRIRMSVINVRETLIAWYERRGYVRTGEVAAFPYGDERFGKPLRQDLGFIVLERRLEPAKLVMHRASA